MATPDSMGREIHAVGFSFCVPESWRPAVRAQDSSDARQWRGSGAALLWDLGRPPAFVGRDVQITTSMAIVRGTNPRPIPQEPPSVCSTKNTPLTPNGVSLIVTAVECQHQWTITAWSTERSMYVQGEARSKTAAELLQQILSTIRFSSPPR